MKSYHILLSILSLIGIIILYTIWNIGLLLPVTVEQTQTPTLYLVYESHTGPYHELMPIFEKIEKALSNKKISCSKTFGLYFDNPDQVEADRLKSEIGCIVDKPVTEELGELQFKELPPFQALKGSFGGAPWLTAFKVYSTLQKESYQRNVILEPTPVLEIYEPNEHGFKTEVYFRIVEKFDPAQE